MHEQTTTPFSKKSHRENQRHHLSKLKRIGLRLAQSNIQDHHNCKTDH